LYPQKQEDMILNLKNMNYQYGFDVESWLSERTPKLKRSSTFWDEVHLEYDEVVQEFRSLLETKEQVFDKKGNPLSPLNLYILVKEYKLRIDKLMLIFNLKLYKTLNENKKSGIKYVVMRAFWIDHNGKNVRWFSKNLGPESKVDINGRIPVHMLDAVEDYILYLMWDQYLIEYQDGDQVTTIDRDGNTIIYND
jgi:hypothetical protein